MEKYEAKRTLIKSLFNQSLTFTERASTLYTRDICTDQKQNKPSRMAPKPLSKKVLLLMSQPEKNRGGKKEISGNFAIGVNFEDPLWDVGFGPDGTNLQPNMMHLPINQRSFAPCATKLSCQLRTRLFFRNIIVLYE